MEKTVNAGEIDLLELGARFLRALKKNLILTIALPILGIVIALLFSYRSKNQFQSGMLIETSLLSDKECKFLFDQLDKVNEFPGITPEIETYLEQLRYEVIKNEATNTTENSVYLQVTATVIKKEIFPPLENLIVKFINESEPVVRHRKERERFYNSMIMKIDSEISAMDEVKANVKSSVQATYLNPSELYEKTVAMYKEKTEYEIKLEEIKTVHLVKGFDSLTIDAKLNKLIVAAIGFIVGGIILILILAIKSFVRYYKLYEATH